MTTGACNYALAWRAMHNPAGRFGGYREAAATGDDQYLAPYGLTNAVMQYALQYSRYLTKYGATREHMATYIVSNREECISYSRIGFSWETDYSRRVSQRTDIADPYCILDCDMPVDACSAVNWREQMWLRIERILPTSSDPRP